MPDKNFRKINKSRYVVASLITLCIFLLGVMLGLVIEDKRIRVSQEEEKNQQMDFRSMQLQYEYINQLSFENDCQTMQETFEANMENLELARLKLEEYTKSSKINKDDFNQIKRDYTISQLQYWLFAKKKKQICDSDDVSILYFFAEDKACRDCNKQSFVLTYLKKIFGADLLIFSINSNFTEEPMVNLLQKSYNVTTFPTMMIDKQKVEGLHNKDDLLKIICPMYTTENEKCKDYVLSERNSSEEI